ncbi:unnamed protein product [Alopecurus aequalis]
MADVEDPDRGAAVEAEPTECCRCMFIWVMGFFFLALMFVFSELTADDSHEYDLALNVATTVAAFLVLIHASWFAVVFAMLVTDWYNGYPEGERVVDSLIQSDRGVFQESIRQYLHRVGIAGH